MLAGKNVGLGKDHTIFAIVPGIVTFRTVRKTGFTGRITHRSVVDVVAK